MPTSPWYKDAIIYELHVRAFCDSSGDGIGDFRGLTEKLGYFEDLGVTALWLLPFYPSPLRDDGYDISDYYKVNPVYGTLSDFQSFLAEAHHRNLKVITELVINHTSDQHSWFQRARRAPMGSSERDFYVWSETPDRFKEARIIFKDFEPSNWSWDPVAKSYYWHRFYSHQPDLNFDNPAVRTAIFDMLDFWLGLGVDGLRLDAIPYLFEREGTSCENLPETHAFLEELRHHVDAKFPDAMLLAEANQWPEDAVRYFGIGDECHMAFHFPLMPRLFMGLQMEDRFPIIDILEQTPTIPDDCQWAIFLRNHDELTLEMVTDEERDYMYRLYAEDPRARLNLGIRRRLAPLLDNNRRKIELINSLLLSLPGSPIIYYGDEIGMGDNFYLGDRNGVRTPMQWSADRNAGFSRSNPQQLFLPVIIDPEFHYEAINVDVQQKNPSSLFWWMRRVLDIRKRHPAFSRGSIEFLRPANAKVLVFLRKHENETLLVIANLSRFSQSVAVDLSALNGMTARELFSGNSFLRIPESPASFTLGPHGFYWLALETADENNSTGATASTDPPLLDFSPSWSPALLQHLATEIIPALLPTRRWFGHKQRSIRTTKILGAPGTNDLKIILLSVVFFDGEEIITVLPLVIARIEDADETSQPIARFATGEIILDALEVASCREALWNLLTTQKTWTDGTVHLMGTPSGESTSPELSRLLGGQQSNSTLAFDEKFLMKIFRSFQPGPNPDAEILDILTKRNFPYSPRFTGSIRVTTPAGSGVLAIVTEYVKNEGNGWTQTLDSLARYYERVLTAGMQESEPVFAELMGANYPARVRQLGERTGALHCCLADAHDLPEFTPEPFTTLAQRSLYQSMRSQLRRTEISLTQRLPELDPETRQKALAWIAAIPRILEKYSVLLRRRFTASKIRVHGDFHLGQVLNTGNDYVILDFEGEPRKSLGERQLKRSALADVAGMLRSFDYAVETSLLNESRTDDLRLWAERWLECITAEFLHGYRTAARGRDFLPDGEDFEILLDLFILDKATYEIGYELAYRPSFLHIPLAGMTRLLLEDPEVNPAIES